MRFGLMPVGEAEGAVLAHSVAVVGATLGHLMFGISFALFSWLGMIAAIGAGLGAMRSERAYVTSTDAPWITPRFVVDTHIPLVTLMLLLWIWLAAAFWALPAMCSSGKYDCAALLERKR